MGYTTDFEGQFNISPAMKLEHIEFINKFSDTRRMARNALAAGKLPDSVREAAGLPVGIQGGYYVGDSDFAGQSHTPDILDYNEPPTGQPGLWCQWVVDEDSLQWNGGEKFYMYTEWLVYMIEHFFKPWGYTLNGTVTWQGEESADRGKLIVKDNNVRAIAGVMTYPGEDD
jgi:hypothetical protein